MHPLPFDDACGIKRQHHYLTNDGSKPSDLHLVPGFGARVIDANLQVRKTALQRDGAAFGTFSGIEFGLDSPIDLESEPG